MLNTYDKLKMLGILTNKSVSFSENGNINKELNMQYKSSLGKTLTETDLGGTRDMEDNGAG